ncbi:putative tonB-dependent receptor protein [Nitrospira japonica]|uniref:Putative tonB-dependent receptor protein n=1 Tax=Nitrospira japonica TaxID=1325564 RepID=A0A1W1IB23_9BACT|nr:TonB-dependent receptor [Nitrospira japonica]SLM50099.1 putative tonB-dependent receptor protein [Nitrospira japonica]
MKRERNETIGLKLHLIGLSVIVLCMIGGVCGLGTGLAQDNAESSETIARMDFHIPAQPLGTALNAFAVTSGWQVSASSELTTGAESPGVVGNYTPEQGLKNLLSGTGLTYRMDGSKMATIERQTSSGVVPAVVAVGAAGAVAGAMIAADGSEEAVVTAQKPVKVPEVVVKDVKERPHREELLPEYPGGDVATGGRLGVLGNREIMDTPFNQTNYTSKVIENQQIRYMADVLNNDPTARASASQSTGADDFSIRGFSVSNQDILFNGLYGVAPTFFNSMMTESLERVEVLKGPSALLAGVAPGGSIGGMINLVPKRAGQDPLTQFTGSYISSTQFGGHADISRRYGSEKQFGIRLNGVYRNGDTAIDYQSRESALASLGMDYRGRKFRLAADLGYQYQNIQGMRDFTTVVAGVQVPTPPNNRGNYDGPYDFSKPTVYYGTLRGEYDLTDNLSAFVSTGGSYRSTRYSLVNRTIVNSQGDLSANNFATMSADKTTAWTVETGLQGRFATGPVQHQTVLAYTTLRRDWQRATVPIPRPASNIYTPTFGPAPDLSLQPDPGSGKPLQESVLSGATLADTLSILDERVQLTVGGRFQTIDIKQFNFTTGVMTTNYNEDKATPMVGLVVKPWQQVAFYANYIEGLQQGPTAPVTAANAGEVFAPFVAKQYEVGAKVDFGRFGTTLAFYQIAQPTGFVNPTTNIFGVDGEQRNRGIDFNVFGEVIEGVRLLGGAAFIDAELTKTQGGINDGHTGIGVPRSRLVLGGEWDTPFLQGFTLFARGTRNSSMFLNAANTQEVPSWARLDLGARYMFLQPNGKPVTIRANVTNVLDSGYWDANAFGQLTLSDPRVFWLSATIDF